MGGHIQDVEEEKAGIPPPCGSKQLDQIKLSCVTSPSVFCGSGLCPRPVFQRAYCLTAV